MDRTARTVHPRIMKRHGARCGFTRSGHDHGGCGGPDGQGRGGRRPGELDAAVWAHLRTADHAPRRLQRGQGARAEFVPVEFVAGVVGVSDEQRGAVGEPRAGHLTRQVKVDFPIGAVGRIPDQQPAAIAALMSDEKPAVARRERDTVEALVRATPGTAESEPGPFPQVGQRGAIRGHDAARGAGCHRTRCGRSR